MNSQNALFVSNENEITDSVAVTQGPNISELLVDLVEKLWVPMSDRVPDPMSADDNVPIFPLVVML